MGMDGYLRFVLALIFVIALIVTAYVLLGGDPPSPFSL